MLGAKGRKAVNKIDENTSDSLPPPRDTNKALRHDVNMPLEDTSLSTVVYILGGGIILYLVYTFLLPK